MPKFINKTNTTISIGGVSSPANSSVEISEEQAMAISPSVFGVDGFVVEYEKEKKEETMKPKAESKRTTKKTEEEVIENE